jgi:hypothetical protein
MDLAQYMYCIKRKAAQQVKSGTIVPLKALIMSLALKHMLRASLSH